MKRPILIGIVLALLLLSACDARLISTADLNAPTILAATNTSNPVTPSSSPTTSTHNAPTATSTLEESAIQRPIYKIVGTLDDQNHQFNGSVEITYPNYASKPLNELVLAVDPNREEGVFHLDAILIEETPIDLQKIKLEKHKLTIPLDFPLASRQQIRVTIQYQLSIPEIPAPSEDTKPTLFGYTTLQTNLVDWYPFIVPYDGESGWVLHDPWYYGEYLVYDVSDFYIDLEIINAPANIIVAASAESQISGSHYIYAHLNARNFALSISPSYVTQESIVDQVTIHTYTFPFNENASEMVMQNAISAIQTYSAIFGPFPRKSLSIVEADFLDGMEYDGFFFLSKGFYNLYDGTPKGYLTAITVHETAHQWWFASIANDQAISPWLDESLCTYSELLYYEKNYPELVDWWWSYRVHFYQPTGWINLPVDQYGGFTPYRDAVYLRGAQFLDHIRATIGDDAFFAFLNDYSNTLKNKIATEKDFIAILSRHTDQNLDNIISAYFQN